MVFKYINICQVALEVLKSAPFGLGFQHLPRDLAIPCLIPITSDVFGHIHGGPISSFLNFGSLVRRPETRFGSSVFIRALPSSANAFL